MALKQMDNFTFAHSNQQDALYTQYTAQQIKSLFDSRGDELRTALNNLIQALNAGTAAGNIGATAPNGLTGSTVQELISSLMTYVQNNFYDKTTLQGITDGNSGADKIKVTQLTPQSGDTVQACLEYLLQQIGSTALGVIPDGSVTTTKLATDVQMKMNTSLNQIGAIPDINGNMTNLNTDDKTKIINAINEVLSKLLALAGVGRTTETVKGVNDSLNSHSLDASTAHGINNKMDKVGGTFTGIVTAQSNTSYATRQVRNMILSPNDADVNAMQNGDIWVKYV